jgi:cytosine/uracil/thiamine/allantoin permease
MGGLLILPALMFGGWIVVAVLGGVLGLAGSIIGGVFEGLGALTEGIFSGSGLLIGIVIGVIAYYAFRKNRARTEDQAETADGEEAETWNDEPVRYARMGE